MLDAGSRRSEFNRPEQIAVLVVLDEEAAGRYVLTGKLAAGRSSDIDTCRVGCNAPGGIEIIAAELNRPQRVSVDVVLVDVAVARAEIDLAGKSAVGDAGG